MCKGRVWEGGSHTLLKLSPMRSQRHSSYIRTPRTTKMAVTWLAPPPLSGGVLTSRGSRGHCPPARACGTHRLAQLGALQEVVHGGAPPPDVGGLIAVLLVRVGVLPAPVQEHTPLLQLQEESAGERGAGPLRGAQLPGLGVPPSLPHPQPLRATAPGPRSEATGVRGARVRGARVRGGFLVFF